MARATSAHYELREDPLDPGWILFEGLRTEMRRQLRAAREEARRGAFLEFLHWMGGYPRPARQGWVLLHWDGPDGWLIPAGVRVRSDDGTRQARLHSRRGIRLGRITAAEGLGATGQSSDLTPRLVQDPAEGIAADAEAFTALRFGLQLPTVDHRQVAPAWEFPGLLWDVLAGIRFRRVHAVLAGGGRKGLRWVRDPAGRIFVPPQRVPAGWVELAGAGESPPAQWLEFQGAVGPGEARHFGRVWLNVTAARPVQDDPARPIPAQTFVCPKTDDGSRVSQPLPGWGGTTEENPIAWERRLAAEGRHRGRAVTADDFTDLLRSLLPGAHILDVAATRVPEGEAYHDAVRLTLIPEAWEQPADLLARALMLAERAGRVLAGRMMAGLRVVAGPPSLQVPVKPASDDRLWLYRDFLVSEPVAQACRRDGVYWPVFRPADLGGALP